MNKLTIAACLACLILGPIALVRFKPRVFSRRHEFVVGVKGPSNTTEIFAVTPQGIKHFTAPSPSPIATQSMDINPPGFIQQR